MPIIFRMGKLTKWRRLKREFFQKALTKPSGTGNSLNQQPYRHTFFGHARHSVNKTRKIHHVQLTGQNPLDNLIGAPVGILVCSDALCNADTTEPAESDSTPTRFIPVNEFFGLDNHTHFIDAAWACCKPDATSDQPSEEAIFFVRIPSKYDSITKDNVNDVHAFIVRSSTLFQKGVPWDSIPDEFSEEMLYNSSSHEDETTTELELLHDTSIHNYEQPDLQSPPTRGDNPTIPMLSAPTTTNTEEKPDEDDYLEIVPQESRRATENHETETLLFFVPTQGFIPITQRFQDEFLSLTIKLKLESIIDSQTRRLIKLQEITAVLTGQSQCKLQFFDQKAANSIIHEINRQPTCGLPKRGKNWISVECKIDDRVRIRPNLAINIRSTAFSAIKEFLNHNDGKIHILENFPFIQGPSNQPTLDALESIQSGPKSSVAKRVHKYRPTHHKSHHACSSSDSETAGSSKHRYRRRCRKRSSSDDEPDQDITDLLAEVRRQFGVDETPPPVGSLRQDPLLQAKINLTKLQQLGVSIPPKDTALVTLGLRFKIIPCFEPDACQRIETAIGAPQLFRDQIQIWIKTFKEYMQSCTIDGMITNTLRPKYWNKREPSHVRQLKILMESAWPYPHTLAESSVATIVSHHSTTIRWMLQNSISYKFTDLIFEKIYSKKQDIARLVKNEALSFPIYGDLLKNQAIFWQRTILKNLSVINNYDEQLAAAGRAVYNAFSSWDADSAIRLAQEHAKRLAYQNKQVQCFLQQGKEVESHIEFIQENITRNLLTEGASAHQILSEAERAFGVTSRLMESSLGVTPDLMSSEISEIKSSLKLATKRLCQQIATMSIQTTIKAGATSTQPRQNRSRTRSPNRPGLLRKRTPSNPPKRPTRTQSPSPQRRNPGRTSPLPPRRLSRPQSPRTLTVAALSASPHRPSDQRRPYSPGRDTRYSPGRDQRPSGRDQRQSPGRFPDKSPRRQERNRSLDRNTSPLRKKCLFCFQQGYDCPAEGQHCRNSKHDPDPTTRLRYPRKRSSCRECTANSKIQSSRDSPTRTAVSAEDIRSARDFKTQQLQARANIN